MDDFCYEQRIRDVDMGSFTPSTFGGMGIAATTAVSIITCCSEEPVWYHGSGAPLVFLCLGQLCLDVYTWSEGLIVAAL